jgi:hypothetical protein
LIKNRLFSRTALRTLQFPQRKHRCALANYGFAAIFAAPKLAGLQQQGRSAAERQSYGSPKNGSSKANRLVMAGCQIRAM